MTYKISCEGLLVGQVENIGTSQVQDTLFYQLMMSGWPENYADLAFTQNKWASKLRIPQKTTSIPPEIGAARNPSSKNQ